MTDLTDLTAYLGDFADDLTDDQRARLERADSQIAERYPIPADGELADVIEERTAALNAATQLVFGESEPSAVVEAWQDARRASDEAHATMTGMIIALSATESERRMSENLHLTRVTIRKALGK